MNNTSIYAAGRKFDIGVRVVNWDEPGGLSGYKYGLKYNKRNIDFEQLKEKTRCFVYHHANSYTAKTTYNGLIGRGLSCNFIIDDDDVNGVATIYQCLDIKDNGYSHLPLNDAGPGVEIAYYVERYKNPQAYNELAQRKMKVQPHEAVTHISNGHKFEAFAPTEAQVRACAYLGWGVCELFDLPATFPRDSEGQLENKAVKNLQAYRGLLQHYHINAEKWDAAGLDLARLEKEISDRLRAGF